MTSITNLPSGGAAIFWGVITFSLLILMHEGGHFLAARAFGVKVHEFMLGLPGPALRWHSKRSGVTYGVTAIPLGGYVRIAGMEPGREDELLAAALGSVVSHGRIDAGELALDLEVPRDRATALLTTLEDYGAAALVADTVFWESLVSLEAGEDDSALLARVRKSVYRGQPTWKRIAILSMGVLVNIVSALLILVLGLTLLGVPTPTPTIKEVASGTPAAAAGLRAGDRVTSFDGHAVKQWEDLRASLRTAKAGVTVPISVQRGNATLALRVTPTTREGGGTFLGVTADSVNVPMGIVPAMRESFTLIGAVFVAIGRLINPGTFKTSIEGARSVVGISYEVAIAAEAGPLSYAWMVALLSLSLGIMNILPIPPLDGGKIAVEIVERIFRRQVPRKVSLAFSALGTLLLFSLVFYLMYADVMRYIIRG